MSDKPTPGSDEELLYALRCRQLELENESLRRQLVEAQAVIVKLLQQQMPGSVPSVPAWPAYQVPTVNPGPYSVPGHPAGCCCIECTGTFCGTSVASSAEVSNSPKFDSVLLERALKNTVG